MRRARASQRQKRRPSRARSLPALAEAPLGLAELGRQRASTASAAATTASLGVDCRPEQRRLHQASTRRSLHCNILWPTPPRMLAGHRAPHPPPLAPRAEFTTTSTTTTTTDLPLRLPARSQIRWSTRLTRPARRPRSRAKERAKRPLRGTSRPPHRTLAAGLTMASSTRLTTIARVRLRANSAPLSCLATRPSRIFPSLAPHLAQMAAASLRPLPYLAGLIAGGPAGNHLAERTRTSSHRTMQPTRTMHQRPIAHDAVSRRSCLLRCRKAGLACYAIP